jgi:hypothetical protein
MVGCRWNGHVKLFVSINQKYVQAEIVYAKGLIEIVTVLFSEENRLFKLPFSSFQNY